jgi:hypothetical protein
MKISIKIKGYPKYDFHTRKKKIYITYIKNIFINLTKYLRCNKMKMLN